MKTATLFLAVMTFSSLLHSQNVGFNTNTPAYPLTLVAPPSGKGITQVNGSVAIGFYTSVASAILQTYGNYNLHFGTNSPGPSQMTLTTAGYLGIGTAPTNHLDIEGTIRLQGGNPAAGRILNATDINGNSAWKAVPVTGGTKTMFVPFSAFTGSISYMGYENINNVSRRATGYLAADYRYQAPLLLPVGTVIKEISWKYFDNNVELNLDFALVRDFFGDPNTVSTISSGGALNVDFSKNVTVNHTLGNYFYWLDISTFSWSSDASLRFKGAMITYE
ncbi:MAG: hypothetical protein V4717_15315 [Bacteroidota bacterium]